MPACFHSEGLQATAVLSPRPSVHAHCLTRFARAGLTHRPRRTAHGAHCSLISPANVFTAATFTIVPVYACLLGLAGEKTARRVATSSSFPAGLAGAYVICLATWWSQPGCGGAICHVLCSGAQWPDAAELGRLFHSEAVTVLAWLHLLCLDLWLARMVALDSWRQHIFAAHSIILCFMCGPVGLLSHMLTKLLTRKWRHGRGATQLEMHRAARTADPASVQ